MADRGLRAAVITNGRFESDMVMFFPGMTGIPYRILNRFPLFDCTEGCVVCLAMTGAEMMADPRGAARRVRDAVLFAQDEVGAEVIGLTSLTSSVTMQGRWLADQPGVRAALTHGDSYASALTVDGIRLAVEKTGRRLEDVTVGVLGAYGLIGRAVSLKLGETGCRLLLVGPNPNKLAALVSAMPGSAGQTRSGTDLTLLADADVIVTATSNPGALVSAACVKPGPSKVIIYEVSVPPNLPEEAFRALRQERPNIIKIDGAMAAIPGVDIGFSIPGVPDGTSYSCWAETFMQALSGDTEHHIGEIDVEHMDTTAKWAGQYGFSHAPLACFGEAIAEEEFRN
ncbi:MAG: hypothetical protein R6X14_00720 [bacterium]